MSLIQLALNHIADKGDARHKVTWFEFLHKQFTAPHLKPVYVLDQMELSDKFAQI